MLSRRKFIVRSVLSSVFLGLPLKGWSALRKKTKVAKSVKTVLRAQAKASLATQSFGPISGLWGYNGSTPGPMIRLAQGGNLKVEVKNELPQTTTVHWHGIRIKNSMDGVPKLTQKVIPVNKNFFYNFTTPDAGTYWYHSHNHGIEQLARGLYGPLIVEEAHPPEVDHDIVAFLDDWRVSTGNVLATNFNSVHDKVHQGRLGNVGGIFFHNDVSNIRRNQRVRLRIICTANARVFELKKIIGLKGKIVAYDGMPLTKVEPLHALSLSPGQRVDIIADVVSDIDFLTFNNVSLGKITTGRAYSGLRRVPVLPLPPNKVKKVDLNKALALNLELKGGAMAMQAGSSRKKIWTFNGVYGMTEKPFHRFTKGQAGVITITNYTFFPHVIHLHGHHFEVLAENNRLRDSILVLPNQKQKIACVFENPGKWLLHCHMLGHQKTGMATWIDVV